MWHTGERPWAVHAPRFVSDELDPATRTTFGHRFFLYDLVRWGRPERIVELGAGTGAAFFACCQAVRDSGYAASLHAVDTWDDVVAGATSGGDPLEGFERARAQLFPTLDVHLHRRDLRDARQELDDGSIDLLLLAGHASFEVVKDDYESWFPKVAPGGAVILRDVAPWRRSGTAELWRELSAAGPALTFAHSSGLGIVFPRGADPFGYLLGEEFTRWQSYYEARELAHAFDVEMRQHAAALEDRDTRIGRLERETVGLREQADAARHQLADQRAALTAPAVAPAPVSDTRRMVRLLARLLRRGARAANRRLGTNLRIGAVRSEIDDRIAAVFDAEYYLDRYPDIARAGIDPLDHYRRRGWIEDRDPSPLFWSKWYLERYRDVAETGHEPLQYHLEIGWRAGHDPSPLLRTEWYLDRVPEVRQRGLSPLEHYWTSGYAAGEYANPEQRRRLIAAPSPARPVRRVVAECELLTPGRSARLVTLDALARADVDLVTFDLWDTLVARARPADAAKLATARRIALGHARDLRAPMSPWDLFRLRVATEAEIAGATAHEEYRLTDVLAQHLAAVLDVNGRTARALADDLARQEAAEECRCSYRIDELADTIERLSERDPAPTLMILSDFYLGADALRSVATAADVGVPPDVDVLVSCDLDASKRVGGRLFELARERAGVDASRHLHIGDNPWSDGEQQVATGGTAAIVRLSASPFPGPGELDPQHLRALLEEQRDELLCVVDVLAPSGGGATDTERRAAHAGVLTALLPVSLVAAAVEEALERGLPTVHYLSREGAFLCRVHELIAPTLAGAAPAPAARHVEVSRRSTFGPSISDDHRAGLALMWSQYADQSPRALFESLGVPLDATVKEAIIAVGLTVDGVVAQVQHDERFAALLDRDEVRGHIERTLTERRAALEAYLRQQMDLDRSEVLVVDVGWRGTIQDNLARVLSEHEVHGLYLGLFPFLNPQPPNGSKRGVAFDANAGDPFVHVSPPAAIESPLTPDVPSPVDYAVRADGRVSVVHEQEGPRARAEIEAFQAGVLAAAPRFAEWMVVNGLTSSMLRQELGEIVSEYYGRPEGGVADIWFGSTHDDTFGALNVSPFEKEPPPRGVLSRVATTDVVPDEARRSNWVSGYRAWLSVRALEVLREMWREGH